LNSGHQIPQHRLRRDREHGVPHQPVTSVHSCLREPEQQVLLAGNPLELLDQFLGHLHLGAGVDSMHRGNQQLDQHVGDLPLKRVQQRRQQGQRHSWRVLAQVARRFHRRASPPASNDLRRNAGEHAVGQAYRADRLQLSDLGQHRVQTDVARLRPDSGQHRQPVIAVVSMARLIVDVGGDQSKQPIPYLCRQTGRHTSDKQFLATVQR
jgi:hypothetical protein